MAILTIDETSGVQNVQAGVTTSNDVDLTGGGVLPAEFETLLTAAGAGTPTSAALSGAGTATTTDDFIMSFGANVTEVAFTNSSGGALVGVPAKSGPGATDFLRTSSGAQIFLYSYAGADIAGVDENNVVYARVGTFVNDGGTPGNPYDDVYSANPNGAVAFAAYLDTGTAAVGDVGATGARLWLVQYQSLFQPDPTNPNDVVLMTGSLNVSVNNLTSLNPSGAPSGQNLFLMVGDGTPAAGETAYVVTATNAAAGGTVNTGQASGGTTIGTNNQMVDPAESMTFSFVKLSQASLNYTVNTVEPRLDQTEADDAANILFDTYLASRGASFGIVQLQPPKAATLKITAINNTDTTETGANYISGLSNDGDELANITSVTITRDVKSGKTLTPVSYTFNSDGTIIGANGQPITPPSGLVVSFTDTDAGAGVLNTATITGAKAGDKVAYTTAGDHNRVMIENLGNSNSNLASAFDIGNFQLTTGALTTSPLADVAFVDDGPTIATTGTEPNATADDSTLNTNPTADFAANFTATTFGADGAGTVAYSLGISGVGANSGLVDTATGFGVFLYLVGTTQVVGKVGTSLTVADPGGATSFTATLNAATGVVTLDQARAVVHADTTNPDDSRTLAADTLITLTATRTDKEGDAASATLNIGQNLNFKDDGPTASAVLGAGAVAHDETAGVQGDANDTTAAAVIALFAGVTTVSTQMTAGYAQGSATVIDSSASTGGADGLAGTVYSLAIQAANVDSGLDTVGGQNILLTVESGIVVGRISGGADNGKAAFAVKIDSATGVLSMVQYNAIKHPAGGAASPDESVAIANAVLYAVARVTDGDGDANAAQVDIGARVSFQDDGPSLSFGNLVGTGTVDPQFGYWSGAAGNDGLGASELDVALSGMTLVRPNGSLDTTGTFSMTEAAKAGTSWVYSGLLSGDFDNNAATPFQDVHFTLTVRIDGTYKLDLVEGFTGSTTVISTAGGALGAGGPDPVQTLTPVVSGSPANDKQIVFFNVLATDTAAQVKSMIGIDPTADLTEAQIESGNFGALLGTEAMNVSTAGIGTGNNNMNGNDTSSTGLDESFVANPEFDVTTMRVYIDNSVSGYTPATEALNYTIYYTNGDVSATSKVQAGDIVAGAKSNDPVHFDVVATGGRIIDAVQLTMDLGTIKIPVIEFITATPALANDVQLAFQATVTDGDGDTASSAFQANMLTNELAGSFNFVLTGTSAQDAFNIDLPDLKNTYQVNSFAVGVDKLVLLGANSYTINNTAADCIVDVTETAGGQHTLITVVGVDLAAADIVTLLT